MTEYKTCPNCGHQAFMNGTGSLGTTERIYVCPNCQHQFTE